MFSTRSESVSRPGARAGRWSELGLRVAVSGILGVTGARAADLALPTDLPAAGAGSITNSASPLELVVGDTLPQPRINLVPWWQTNRAGANLVNGAQFGTSAIGGLSPEPSLGAAARSPADNLPPVLRWGPVTVHPSLGYGVSYSTGLLVRPGRPESLMVQTFSPGLSLDLGPRWSVDYSPQLLFYSAPSYRDTVNQAVSLDGRSQRGEWNLDIGNAFSASDNPLVETGRQTQQTANTTRIGATRPLGSKLSLDLGVSQSLRWTGEFNRIFSWVTDDSLSYQLHPGISVGLSGGLGYDQIEPRGDMTSERLQGQLQGRLGEKLSYGLSGGFEFRQFLGTGAPTKISPIFAANVNYQATETTGLGVNYNRQVSPSFFSDQFAETAGVGGGLTQRLFGHLNFSLSGSYRWTDHISTLNPSLTQQTANYASVRAGLGTRFLRRGSISLFFQWSDNASSTPGLSFSSRQMGANVAYGF